MAPVISKPTPSFLCSQFGMVIAIKGTQEDAEKHWVKGKSVSHTHTFEIVLFLL